MTPTHPSRTVRNFAYAVLVIWAAIAAGEHLAERSLRAERAEISSP